MIELEIYLIFSCFGMLFLIIFLFLFYIHRVLKQIKTSIILGVIHLLQRSNYLTFVSILKQHNLIEEY